MPTSGRGNSSDQEPSKTKADWREFAAIFDGLLTNKQITAARFVTMLSTQGLKISEAKISRIRNGISGPADAEEVRFFCDALEIPYSTLMAPYNRQRGLPQDNELAGGNEDGSLRIVPRFAGQRKASWGEFAAIFDGLLTNKQITAARFVIMLSTQGLKISEAKISRIRNGISGPADAEEVRFFCDALEIPYSTLMAPYNRQRGLPQDNELAGGNEDGSLRILPGFAGEESAVGPDLLGIENDAMALAVLLASRSLSPPLALGLFGPWGSGKTFFMRTLEKNINQLTHDADGSSSFARRIVNVWFNAWHYSEGNLWASLIHHILVSLREDPRSAPELFLDAALDKVQGIKKARAEATATATAAHGESELAKAEATAVAEKHEQVRVEAALIRTKDVWQAVLVDERLRERFNEAAAALGIPQAGASARELAQAVDEVRALVERGRLLTTGRNWWRTPLFLGVVAAALVSAGGLVLASTVDWAQTWLAPMVAGVTQLAAIVSGGAAWLTRQTSMAKRLLEPAERIRHEIDSRLAEAEARRQAAIELAQQRLDDADAELHKAQQRLAELEAKHAEAEAAVLALTGPRMLDHYLNDRVASADYGRYLGVIALAHRDLQDLNDYLRHADGQDLAVERIVLYIDDLDRCPPETVVKVLEAVHLILALPLFVVVVGVDSRWLARSLQDRHPLLLSEGEDTRATPADYLDKIFQLSYRLAELTPESCTHLLRQTALRTQPVMPSSGLSAAEDAVFASQSDNASARAPARVMPSSAAVAALTLEEAELEVLQRVAPLVSGSPRRAKRFLNVYRIVKARGLTGSGERATFSIDQLTTLMLTTALAVGVPSIADSITVAQPGSSLDQWLDQHLEAAPRCPETKRLRVFRDTLGTSGSQLMGALQEWIALARPFAWPASR